MFTSAFWGSSEDYIKKGSLPSSSTFFFPKTQHNAMTSSSQLNLKSLRSIMNINSRYVSPLLKNPWRVFASKFDLSYSLRRLRCQGCHGEDSTFVLLRTLLSFKIQASVTILDEVDSHCCRHSSTCIQMTSNTSTPFPLHKDSAQFVVSPKRSNASPSVPVTSSLFPKLYVRSFKARAQNPVPGNLHVLEIFTFLWKGL